MGMSKYVFIILTVLSLSVGQILFKLAAEQIQFSLSGLWPAMTNVRLIIAMVVYVVATGMWLFVLKQMPLRVAYPFVALAFVFVPILGALFLGERLHWNSFAGALLIGAGVWVSALK